MKNEYERNELVRNGVWPPSVAGTNPTNPTNKRKTKEQKTNTKNIDKLKILKSYTHTVQILMTTAATRVISSTFIGSMTNDELDLKYGDAIKYQKSTVKKLT